MNIARPLLLAVVCAFLTSSGFAGESREAIVDRVGADIEYFASDALEGRGVETRGIHFVPIAFLRNTKSTG